MVISLTWTVTHFKVYFTFDLMLAKKDVFILQNCIVSYILIVNINLPNEECVWQNTKCFIRLSEARRKEKRVGFSVRVQWKLLVWELDLVGAELTGWSDNTLVCCIESTRFYTRVVLSVLNLRPVPSSGFHREPCRFSSRAAWRVFSCAPSTRTGRSGTAEGGPAASGLSSARWSTEGRFCCSTSETWSCSWRGTCERHVDPSA